MSRDVGDQYKFFTFTECKFKLKRLKKYYKSIGYCIWFATIYDHENKVVLIYNGPAYY